MLRSSTQLQPCQADQDGGADYAGAVIHHLNIANIYRMQASYTALMKLVVPNEQSDKSFWNDLEVRNIIFNKLKIFFKLI